jgi:hypothetical protein
MIKKWNGSKFMTIESMQKKLLERILNSEEFSHSKIYQTFLTYLVESARQGKELKETTIAIEVLGKDSSFNPAEDTIVRSHTYTLRKKLESYYFHEGKEDKYRLKIPKGHYAIKFVPVSYNLIHPKNLFRLLNKKYYFFVIAALCGLLLIQWLQNRAVEKELKDYHIVDKNDPVWKEYLQSDLPILIVVGDHFFFNDYSDKYRSQIGIRHPKINSMEDFQSLYPDIRVEPSPEPYFPYHSIWSLPPVLAMLFSVKETPILRKSSDVSPQMLDEYNIIFLGSIKTLYILKHTLLKSHFRYEIAPHRVIYSPPDSNSVRIFTTSLHSPGPNEDLVLALKLPGPANNSIFIIASYHSLGVPEITYYLTNPSKRMKLDQLFKEKYGKIPQYFEILFRVTGIDKTAYSTEVLVYNKITSN